MLRPCCLWASPWPRKVYLRTVYQVGKLTDGHDAEAAANGVEALGLLNRHWYDLIVSDLKMPALNGPGLYREVLRRWPNHHPQVLFVSGFADTAAYAHFLNGVHVPVMCKPFKPEHLVETIRRMLDEHEGANRGCGRVRTGAVGGSLPGWTICAPQEQASQT